MTLLAKKSSPIAAATAAAAFIIIFFGATIEESHAFRTGIPPSPSWGRSQRRRLVQPSSLERWRCGCCRAPSTSATSSNTSSRRNAADVLVEGDQGSENLMTRSLVEENLLRKNQGVLFMATKGERAAATREAREQIKKKKRAERSKGSSQSGGFSKTKKGGNSITMARKSKASSGHLEFSTTVDKNGFGAIVMQEGVARIDGCLSPESAHDLLRYVNRTLDESIALVENGDEMELSRFANVLSKKNRWDMLLPLEESDEVMGGLHQLFGEGSDLGEAIESIVGKDAELYELASLISDPGSEQQVVHPDFPYQDTLPPALTCFVALQDISADMGPTTFIPKSATFEHHQELKDRLWDINSQTGLLATSPNQISTLGSGDCSLYNPMTLHCGGANRSEQRRCLFYFSFQNPALNPSTDGASLRPELRERLITLKSLRKLLKDWKKDRN